MFTDGDLAATARDGYDAFDCSRAVALIGFLGLLSNFQDIIDDIVNNGRRKRRRIESALPHEIRLWDALQDVLSALTSTPGTLNSTQSEDDFDNNAEQQSHPREQEQDILQEKIPHSGLLSDLAEVGPQLALWIVDVADGRLPGDRGHLNACEVSRILSRGHGWPGSFAAHLLTSTMAGALSSHTSSRKLLKESGLLDGTSSCTY